MVAYIEGGRRLRMFESRVLRDKVTGVEKTT
jgi:hypothetical protein